MRTGDTAANDRQKLIRRPPDLLITTPESLYLMLTSSARETLRGRRDGHHRRDPCDGDHQARGAPDADAGAPGADHRSAAATHRAVRHPAAPGGGRRVPRWVRPSRRRSGRCRSSMPASARRSRSRSSSRSRTCRPSGRCTVELTPGPATAALTERRTSIWPSIYPEILQRILANRTTIIFCNARRSAERLAAKLNELADRTRACRASSTPRPASVDRRVGPRSPRVAGARAAGRDRGPAEARGAPGDRRDIVAGAGHRHGCGRPRDPGRVAGRGQPRAPAHRARRPPGGRTVTRLDLPEAPRRPARSSDRHPSDDRR